MSPDQLTHSWRREGLVARVPAHWRTPLAMLAVASAALVALTLREWGEMLHQWWNIDTYNHILLVLPIVGWLVWNRREDLASETPRSWMPGLAIVGTALTLWLAGRIAGINLFAHAGAVGALQGAVIAILGPRIAMLILLPLGMATFLVPFGDEIIPSLQMITAEIAIALTIWSGVPAVINGIHIDTPVGLFIVAEACSGVKFLIAMVTLAVLVCFTRFESWWRRTAFMAASIIVPILANGVRAWGTIYVAQSQGVEFAAGFDHIFYGWIFFAVVVGIVLAAAWPYFERDPDNSGYRLQDLDQMAWIAGVQNGPARTAGVVVAIALLAIVTGIAAAIVPPMAIG